MKVLVCISKTPDTTAKIAFTDNNTKFATEGVQWIINPYDEWYALVRAIEIKELDPSTIIHLVTVGEADAEPIIRKALALGGDEAIRINIQSNDSFVVASQIAQIAKSLKDLGCCSKPHLLPSARACDLYQELDPLCMGSSAPTTPSQDDILLCVYGAMAKNSPDQ